ncbi:MAG: zinc ribbon domain-containing protein [Candidatus Lokiarchaeota archaeon]|nr:zinc ribbon domain-containing protein [Candidatus Lokiarchaeota archaeon]
MTFVPIIVPNRQRNSYRSRSGSACAAVALALVIFGLLSFVMFGMFDLNRFSFPPMIFLSGFIVFIIIIIGISAISISISETYKKPKEQHLKSYYSHFQSQTQPQKQRQQFNPYIIHKSIQNEPEEHIYKEIKRDIPVVSDINYCRFCGAKVDRDAVFCYQCGINISS